MKAKNKIKVSPLKPSENEEKENEDKAMLEEYYKTRKHIGHNIPSERAENPIRFVSDLPEEGFLTYKDAVGPPVKGVRVKRLLVRRGILESSS